MTSIRRFIKTQAVPQLMRTRPFHIKMSNVSPSGEIHLIFGLLCLFIYLFLNFILFLNFTNCISFAKYQNESILASYI